MSADSVVVRLWDHVGTALVVQWPSGVVYENQVGGHACDVRRAEGILVPIGNDQAAPHGRLLGPEPDLHTFFIGSEHHGVGAPRGLTERDAAEIEGVLARHEATASITVDRERLGDSCEAWVHVLMLADGGPLLDLLGVAGQVAAVLTWPNSD